MIKKINIDALKVGMFIHDFQCGWNNDTIFIEKMMITDLKVVEIFRSWGISEVLIDTATGLDTDRPRTTPISQPSPAMIRKPAQSPVPFAVEVKMAENIRNEAIRAVQDLCARAQAGKPPNVDLAYEVAGKMMSSIRRNRDALVLLTRIRQKDQYTLYHSMSTSSLMLTFCDFKGLPERESLDLAVGALLHDIGKMRIPGVILNKPAKLTMEEFTVMKKHAEYAIDLLQKAKDLPLECFDIALHHHEKLNGSGYPHGLAHEQIGKGAMMTAICDVFDAVTSTRCYKEGMGTVSGLKLLYDNCGSHFHPELAHEFIECMGVYPVGSCVRLSDGRIGLVCGRTDDMQKPMVKIFRDARRKEKFSPITVDLSPTDTIIAGYAPLKSIGLTPSSALGAIYQNPH